MCVYSTWKRPALWTLPVFPLRELELRVVWFGHAHCHLPRELWTHSSFLSFCLFFKTALFQFRGWQRFILLQGKSWLEQTQSKGPVLILTDTKPSPEDEHFLSSYFHFHQVKIWVPDGIIYHEQKCLTFTESTRNTTHFLPRHCQLLQLQRISSPGTEWSTSVSVQPFRFSLPPNWGAQTLVQAGKNASHLQRPQTWAGRRTGTWGWSNPTWKAPAGMREINRWLKITQTPVLLLKHTGRGVFL